MRATVFSNGVTSPSHVSLSATVRSLGPFPQFWRVAFLWWPALLKQTSDSSIDMPGAFPRALPLHVLCEHAPVPCPWCACLAVLFVMQMQHKRCSCCNSRLVRAFVRACPALACACFRVEVFLCLRVCFVLYFINMLNCDEFPNPIDSHGLSG